jgi:hypothetical protein
MNNEDRELEKKLMNLVVGKGCKRVGIKPITMAEVMVNQMSKPNLKPFIDFIRKEKQESYKKGWKDALEIDEDIKDSKAYIQGFADCNKLHNKDKW